MICPKCNSPVPNDSVFCEYCGNKLISYSPAPRESVWRACPKCGGFVPADAVFCESCGQKLSSGSSTDKLQWKSILKIVACCIVVCTLVAYMFGGSEEPSPSTSYNNGGSTYSSSNYSSSGSTNYYNSSNYSGSGNTSSYSSSGVSSGDNLGSAAQNSWKVKGTWNGGDSNYGMGWYELTLNMVSISEEAIECTWNYDHNGKYYFGDDSDCWLSESDDEMIQFCVGYGESMASFIEVTFYSDGTCVAWIPAVVEFQMERQ